MEDEPPAALAQQRGVRPLPPRPDVGAVLLGLLVAVLLAATGHAPGSAIFLGMVTAILALPLLLLAREFALYSTRSPLPPERAGRVADWLAAVAREAGAARASVLYVYRKGVGMQLLQFGEPVLTGRLDGQQRRRLEFSLAALVHKASWNGLAAAGTYNNLLVLAVPARTMELLEPSSGMGRSGPYLEVSSEALLRTVYRLVREVVAALQQNAGRILVSYTTTKLMARLVLKGLLRLRGKAVEAFDRVVPAEPPWIRVRVARQLELERIEAISAIEHDDRR